MQKPIINNSDKEKISLKKMEKLSILTANKARESLKNLDSWKLTDDHKMIYREFILQDFMAAIDRIDRIALIAEDEKHHPDLHLTQFRNLRVALTTHDVGGLSEKDFMVARKIDDLPVFNKAMALNQQLKMKKPRYEQKDIQPKTRKSISSVLKKEKNIKIRVSSK